MSGRYGGPHAAIRRAAAPYVAGSPCVRCGRVIRADQPWDLDHSDDRTGYLGPAHRSCNRRAGQAKGVVMRRERRRKIMDMVAEVALGIEVSEDRAHTSVCAAGQLDGGAVLVELAGYLDGTGGAVAAVLELRAARKVTGVAIDPHSGAATLIKPLTDAKVKVRELTTSEAGIAHNEFLDRFRAGQLRHVRSSTLTTAMKHYEQRRLGEGTLWMRRGAPADISAAIAAAIATWALVHLKSPKPMIVISGQVR